jgi:sugar phosphate isomerase/epimerase
MPQNNLATFPKVHNAMWPGLVGKGDDAEPAIDLDTMLDFTGAASVDGERFDGVDLFLSDPHISIDSSAEDVARLSDKIGGRGFVVGSLVAPVWQPTGGGSAMGPDEDRKRFLKQIQKACVIGEQFRRTGIRTYGVIRIDSATGLHDWLRSPHESTKRIAETFREACNIAEAHGERLAAEGEICWGGMHSWRRMLELLETVGRPQTLGFQADMAHTLLYTLGYNAPEDRILPETFEWSDEITLHSALKQLASALRPWTIDFHVAQNDGTVKGSGSHDKTGHHCLPHDVNGRLNLVRDAGLWLRDDSGNLTKSVRHICWDGCMFPNDVMRKPETWNSILGAMLAVRNAHSWQETAHA